MKFQIRYEGLLGADILANEEFLRHAKQIHAITFLNPLSDDNTRRVIVDTRNIDEESVFALHRALKKKIPELGDRHVKAEIYQVIAQCTIGLGLLSREKKT